MYQIFEKWRTERPLGRCNILTRCYKDLLTKKYSFSPICQMFSPNCRAGCVVDVVEPVTVISQPEVKTPQEGATLELECNARGNPPPEITWFRDGKKVVADEVYITDNGLVILSATRKMSGIWKCLAKNFASRFWLRSFLAQIGHNIRKG
jgi:hypothetical protein